MNKRLFALVVVGLSIPGVAFAATLASGACCPGCPFCP